MKKGWWECIQNFFTYKFYNRPYYTLKDSKFHWVKMAQNLRV